MEYSKIGRFFITFLMIIAFSIPIMIGTGCSNSKGNEDKAPPGTENVTPADSSKATSSVDMKINGYDTNITVDNCNYTIRLPIEFNSNELDNIDMVCNTNLMKTDNYKVLGYISTTNNRSMITYKTIAQIST